MCPLAGRIYVCSLACSQWSVIMVGWSGRLCFVKVKVCVCLCACLCVCAVACARVCGGAFVCMCVWDCALCLCACVCGWGCVCVCVCVYTRTILGPGLTNPQHQGFCSLGWYPCFFDDQVQLQGFGRDVATASLGAQLTLVTELRARGPS